MATKTSTKTKQTKKQNPRDQIMEAYQDHLLMHGEAPASVYAFCKELGMKEADFYQHFNNFGQIAAAFWTDRFEKNRSRLEKTPEFESFTVREKLLSFYYSFFEDLKQNRSYALLTLQGKSLALKGESSDMGEFKKAYTRWIKTLVAEGVQSGEIASRSKLSGRYDGIFWLQLTFLLDFWSKDGSTDFERTDEAIEKAVHFAFDLIEKNALDSAFDFGKFLFQNFS